MRGRALAEGIPKDQVSCRQLASALLELAGEDDSPFVVFLMDRGSAVLKSKGMCQRCERYRIRFVAPACAMCDEPPERRGDGLYCLPACRVLLLKNQGLETTILKTKQFVVNRTTRA